MELRHENNDTTVKYQKTIKRYDFNLPPFFI